MAAEPVSLGDAVVEPEGRDVSVLAGGLMAHRARTVAKALADEGISVEVVDVCSLNPMPWDAVVASVEKTGRAIVVDEGRLTCSVASELAAGIGERAFEPFGARCGGSRCLTSRFRSLRTSRPQSSPAKRRSLSWFAKAVRA